MVVAPPTAEASAFASEKRSPCSRAAACTVAATDLAGG